MSEIGRVYMRRYPAASPAFPVTDIYDIIVDHESGYFKLVRFWSNNESVVGHYVVPDWLFFKHVEVGNWRTYI